LVLVRKQDTHLLRDTLQQHVATQNVAGLADRICTPKKKWSIWWSQELLAFRVNRNAHPGLLRV